MLVPANHGAAIRGRISFRFVGGHYPGGRTGGPVVTPTLIVVDVIDQRRAQHESLRIPRIKIELLYACQILLGRRRSHLLKQPRVALSDHLNDRVIEMLSSFKLVPAGAIERL